jgi:phosphoribosyl-AMP cyclohydrolase
MKSKSIEEIDFEKRSGLVPVIVQDQKTRDILMLAYVNKEALEHTIKTGKAHFWSTSRNKLWLKGEESGNIHFVKDILIDCDCDAVLYAVNTKSNTCHTGSRSCFHNILEKEDKIDKI